MIQSFRNSGLKLFWETGATRRLPNQQFARRVRQLLAALDAAGDLRDVNQPGFHFHGLGQMDPGRYSLRISGNWRITFAWADGHAVQVDIEDYH